MSWALQWDFFGGSISLGNTPSLCSCLTVEGEGTTPESTRHFWRQLTVSASSRTHTTMHKERMCCCHLQVSQAQRLKVMYHTGLGVPKTSLLFGRCSMSPRTNHIVTWRTTLRTMYHKWTEKASRVSSDWSARQGSYCIDQLCSSSQSQTDTKLLKAGDDLSMTWTP